MDLTKYVTWYAQRRDLEPSSERQYLTHVRILQQRTGLLDVGDLTADLIGQHLRAMKLAGRSDSYRRGVRSHLMALLRAAAEDTSLTRRPVSPERSAVPVVRVRDAFPKGYSYEQACRLLAAAARLRGVYRGGISRRLWWQAWVPAAWDSGLAPCDLLALRRASIGPDGSYYSVRLKTGTRVLVRFRETTVQAIDAAGALDRELVFPRWGTYEALSRSFRRLTVLADVGGSLKWLRSGSGSDVERQHPGAGHIHLSNTRQVFEQHYQVDAITAASRPRPRQLDVG